MKYYKLYYSDEEIDEVECGVGILLEKYKKQYRLLEDNIGKILDIEQFKGMIFTIKEGAFFDLLPTNVGRLYSPKLMSIIDKYKNEHDCMQWIKVSVYLNDICKDYYILHFCEIEDMIDKKKSFYSAGVLVKPIFKYELLSKHCIAIEDEYSETPIICEKLKQEIEKEKIKGVDFRKVKIREP